MTDQHTPGAAGGATCYAIAASALVAAFPGPALLVDEDGAVIAHNAAGRRLIVEEPAGGQRQAGRYAMPPLAETALEAAMDGLPRQIGLEVPDRQGLRLVELALLPLDRDQERAVLVLGRDATLERALRAVLTESRERFQDLALCFSDFTWETAPDGTFTYVSPHGAFGYSAAELEGRPARSLIRGDARVPVLPFESREPMQGVELWLTARTGETVCVETSSLPFYQGNGRVWAGARGVCRDVTELRLREAELADAYARLERQSQTDELTRLYNRRAFFDLVPKRLAHLERHRRTGALLFCDLDNFKVVNDLQGHDAGDALLVDLARGLQDQSRGGDVAARLGGDEFTLWLEDVGAPGAVAKGEAIRDMVVALGQAYGSASQPLGVSVGVALFDPDSGEPLDALVKRADGAMYDAKRAGKNCVRLAPTAPPDPAG